MNKKTHTISPYYQAAVIRGAQRLNYDTDALLQAAGLDKLGSESSVTERLAPEKVTQLIRSVWRAMDDEFMGFTEQRCQHVANHGAAGVADMHWPGRIGRNIFDIYRLTGADFGIAIGQTCLKDFPDLALPESCIQTEINEAGPGDVDGIDPRGPCQSRGYSFRQIPRH